MQAAAGVGNSVFHGVKTHLVLVKLLIYAHSTLPIPIQMVSVDYVYTEICGRRRLADLLRFLCHLHGGFIH